MTSSQFNGVGQYPGDISTIAPYLTTDVQPAQFLYSILVQRKLLVIPNSFHIDEFLFQYNVTNPLPQNIDSFAQAFAQFYNLQSVYGSLAAATAQIKSDMINAGKAALQINPNSFGTFGPEDDDLDPLINPIGTQIPPTVSTISDDMATRAINDFLKTFTYPGTSGVLSANFQDEFGGYFLQIANVRNDYRYIFEAFFANNTQTDGFTDFEHALSGFIKNIMYPSSGNGDTFLPGHDYSDWFVKVQQEYAKSLYGAGSNVQTSIGPSVEKTVILDIIFRLIVKMIGTLQIVTAAQSERLKFLTAWQRAYTNLEGQIRTFIKNGPEWIQGDDDRRNQLNQLNQTYTEQIRSRRTVVSDDAKALQTNINQSNDVANQQTSLATAIIQELSTILSAIYR